VDYMPAGDEHVFTLTPPRAVTRRQPKLVA
jgi:hypothetical protein